MNQPARNQPVVTRREMLFRSAHGFGGLALACLLERELEAATARVSRLANPFLPRAPHFPPKAKSVIFLFMDGGPSQIDTFDYKPRLQQEHGQEISIKTPRTAGNIGKKLMKSPYRFRQHGECGAWVSEIFPHVATCVDDIAFVHSMYTDHAEHTAGCFFMHTGFGQQGYPSMGAWLVYGLGNECDDLPGFVVLDSGVIPKGGRDNFGSGFLPASYQGTLFRQGKHPVADILPREPHREIQQGKLNLLRQLNRGVVESLGERPEIEAVIATYELAFRMQTAVPNLLDFHDESPATLKLYGIDQEQTDDFGRQCLLARRLVERGVRFVELVTPSRPGIDRWDQHSALPKQHRINALATDQPIAALLKDLKVRGMLDETLVVWGGEFGRTPMVETAEGRDHNPFGFTMWMAGGGTKGGTMYGATDDYGYFAVQDKVHVHDLHATILHLLGIDHTRLTFRFSSRDMRLTDVHGHVVDGIIA